jgi:hypothetical protein
MRSTHRSRLRRGIEPIVLREGALGVHHARHLVERAVEGIPFSVNVFGAAEALLEHRRTYDAATLL